MNHWLVTIMAVAAAAAPALAQTTAPCACELAAPTGPAQTQPAPASAPATAPADQAALKILDDLEKAGQVHQTIQADVVHLIENPVLGDTEQRTGWVAYQGRTEKTPAMIRLHFDTLKQGQGPKIREKLDYAFDGQWATKADYRTRIMTLYQVPPDQQANALNIGKGPLPPLPFGQKAEEVLQYFLPSTRPIAAGEPADTVYLKLTALPRQAKDMNFAQLEMWIDSRTHIPVRIVGLERNKNIQRIDLANVKTNQKLKEEVFKLPQTGWKVEIRPLEE